jgi:hypothetical protein
MKNPIDPDDLVCTVEQTQCQPTGPNMRPSCDLLRTCCAARCSKRFTSVGAKAACVVGVCIPAYLICKLKPGEQ